MNKWLNFLSPPIRFLICVISSKNTINNTMQTLNFRENFCLDIFKAHTFPGNISMTTLNKHKVRLGESLLGA